MLWIDNIGKEIKSERMSWGMSRTKLSRLSHVDRETIEEIETGKIKNPNFDDMLNICSALDSSIFFYLKEGKIND